VTPDLPKIIWVLWLQGWREAPQILRACLKTWQKWNPEWTVRPLSAENVCDFIGDSKLLQAVCSKNLRPAALSDVIRIALLERLGGVWADSTVYCLRPLDEWLGNHMASGIFAFTPPDDAGRMVSNWFLAASPRNYIISTWAKRALDYWTIHDKRDHYFWSHRLFGDCYRADSAFRKAWDAVPKLSSKGPARYFPQAIRLWEAVSAEDRELFDTVPTPLLKLSHKLPARDPPRDSVLRFLCDRALRAASENGTWDESDAIDEKSQSAGEALMPPVAASASAFSSLASTDVSLRPAASAMLRWSAPGRRAILVLGVGRSGTSALTRVLALCGAALPIHVTEPQPANERGFWEPEEIVAIHEDMLQDMLQSSGFSWRDSSEFPRSWFQSDAAEQYKLRLVAALEREFLDAPLFVVKDPRICRLVSFWLSVLDRFGAEPLIVIPVRNPLEVAASRKKLGGRPEAGSYLLWLRHFLDAERDSRGLKRSFVTYEALLRNWQSVVDKIGRDLDVDWPRRTPEAAVEIDTFLSARLRHERSSEEEVDARSDVPQWVKRAFDWARRAACGEPAAGSELDAIAQALKSADEAFMPVIAASDRAVSRLVETSERVEERAAAAEERLAAKEAEVAALLARAVEAEGERDALLRSPFWRATAPARALAAALPAGLRRQARQGARGLYPFLSPHRLAARFALRRSLRQKAQIAPQPGPLPRGTAASALPASRARPLRESENGEIVPELSVVVFGYRMARELPRTLLSLSPAMQKGITAGQYEVIAMDKLGDGPPTAPQPMESAEDAATGMRLRRFRFETAPPSPAHAINFGLRQARGSLIGVMIDGARLASPGLLAGALLAARLDPRPVVSSLGFHLGPATQEKSVGRGYDQRREDRLLEESGWSEDGYRLFDISVLASSSWGGFFLPIAESNALFMPRALWDELGGFDEDFASPGGGLLNLDTYVRACALPETRLLVLLGEGTFHQVHGGVSTNAPVSPWDSFHAEYVRLRGKDFAPPDCEPIYLGRVPRQALRIIEDSARLAREQLAASGECAALLRMRSELGLGEERESYTVIPVR
jgi:hypothetical protein